MKLLLTVLSCLVLANDVCSLHGGTQATLGQHPTQVAITLPGNRFCSGTIIHANHVLTSARCVLNENNELVLASATSVRAGTLGAGDPLTAAQPAVALFPHPQYSPFTGEHDIAVIRTQQNFTVDPNLLNPPMALAERYLRVIPDATACTVAAWNTPTPAVGNPLLQFAAVTVIGRDACSAQNALLESMMCARSLLAQNRPAICEGNRGAGLFCRDRLVGVTSGGFACADVNSVEAGVYTQVRMYDRWIQQQFNRTRIPAAGPTPDPGRDSAASTTVSVVLLGAVAMILIL